MKNDFGNVQFKDSMLNNEYKGTMFYERLTMGIETELGIKEQEDLIRKNYAEVITDINGTVPLFELGILHDTGIEELHVSMHNILLDKLKGVNNDS
jgi:hypothetical protein